MIKGPHGLAMTRRQALLGAATLGAAGQLGMPYIANAAAAEPIKIGLLLAKTGDIAAQTEYLANGTYLALEERGNMIMGRPAELVWCDEPVAAGLAAEHAEAGAGDEGRSPSSAARSVPTALAEQATAAQLEDSLRLRQCRRHRDERQELQPLHVPAEHAGLDAGGDVRAVHHGLRQEVVFPHRRLCVRPGHRQVVQGDPGQGRRHHRRR